MYGAPLDRDEANAKEGVVLGVVSDDELSLEGDSSEEDDVVSSSVPSDLQSEST